MRDDWIADFLRALPHVPTRTDAATLSSYAGDESGEAPVLPHLVALPRTSEEVRAVVATCMRLCVPVTPAGARTGKSGGSIPLCGGVSVGTANMSKVLEIRAEDRLAVVQPGVILADFQRAVEARGLFYPPDPNSAEFCTIGGTIAENAGGPRSLKYGVTRDYVLGMQWVTPTAQVLRVGRRTRKGAAGYDLTSLLVGSEGTLGIATEATLRLVPLPREVATAVVSYANLALAMQAVASILSSGVWPRSLELLDDVSLDATHGFSRFVSKLGTSALIIETDSGEVGGALGDLQALLKAGHAPDDTPVAITSEQRREVWGLRATVSRKLREKYSFKVSEDVVVPQSALLDAMQEMKLAASEVGLVASTYGHIGDGNLHVNLLGTSQPDVQTIEALIRKVLSIALRYGGTISGEHGVGIAKRKYLPLEASPELIDLQRRLRVAFDPAGLFNPGKVFEEPRPNIENPNG